MPVTIPVDFDTNAASLEREIDGSVKKATNNAERDLARGGARAGSGFASGFKKAIGVGAALGIGQLTKTLVVGSLDEAREAQKVGAATELLVRKLGKSANVTTKGIEGLSSSISTQVGLDDELIQTGANVLLGFKNIRNELGLGNQVFDRATKAAVDLSATPLFKGNLTAATKALGKALTDPEKGLQALGRAGVKFNASQVERIKNFSKEGDLLAAQKIILREVERRYQGTAASQATASEKAQVAIGNLKEEIGTALLPVVDDLANFTTNKAVPAISDLATEFQNGTGTGGEIRDVLEDVGDALEVVFDIGKGVVGVFSDLPGPVKSSVVQLGLAYLALRQIQGVTGPTITGVRNFTTEMRNAETRMDAVTRRSQALGAGLRNVAGAGGMVAVAASTKTANDGLSTFLSLVGGAATGFAIGGPIGALIGGVGGGLLGIVNAKNQVDESLGNTQVNVDYAASLDQITAASTKATRQMAFQAVTADKDLTTSLNTLGISTRDFVSAVLGGGAALDRIDTALAKAEEGTNRLDGVLDPLEIAIGRVGAGLQRQTGSLAEATARTKAQALATEDLATVYEGLPKRVITEIRELGGALTEQQIIDLTRRYDDIDNRDVRTLLGVNNLPNTLADIRRVNEAANNAARDRYIEIRVRGSSNANLAGIEVDDNAYGSYRYSGGTTLVGERGPELVTLPGGTRIDTAAKTRQVLSEQSGGGGITINQNYYGPSTSSERRRELEWTLRYGTRARGVAV